MEINKKYSYKGYNYVLIGKKYFIYDENNKILDNTFTNQDLVKNRINQIINWKKYEEDNKKNT